MGSEASFKATNPLYKYNMSEIVKPVVTEDGIELYATDTECGMSQIGLARFVGVPENSLRSVLTNAVRGSSTSETLKVLVDKDLYLAVQGTRNAKVLRSEVVALVCEHYAFEKNSEKALYSYRKFAKLGIDSWIRQATGHSQPVANQLTPEHLTIQLLLDKTKLQEDNIKLLQEVKLTQEKLYDKERYITKATLNAPGLAAMLDNAPENDEDQLLLEPSSDTKETWTLLEWLEEFKFPIPDKMYRQFRLKVSGVFESLRHYSPKKEYRTSTKGHSIKANVYDRSDFHYLDNVFLQVLVAYTTDSQIRCRTK